jgi:hypothetical protein
MADHVSLTLEEKAKAVLLFAETENVTSIRRFCSFFGTQAPA